MSRSSHTRSSSEKTGYRVIPRRRKASKAVHPESAASCSAATIRRSPLATSESMRCGAWSCSLARAFLAGPTLSSAERAAEASTTITCRRVQHLGRAILWRCSHRRRAGYRATQGCPLCATPLQVPSPLPPLPTLRRELRAAPNARRRHLARSLSTAFSCRNMLARNSRVAKTSTASVDSTQILVAGRSAMETVENYRQCPPGTTRGPTSHPDNRININRRPVTDTQHPHERLGLEAHD